MLRAGKGLIERAATCQMLQQDQCRTALTDSWERIAQSQKTQTVNGGRNIWPGPENQNVTSAGKRSPFHATLSSEQFVAVERTSTEC